MTHEVVKQFHDLAMGIAEEQGVANSPKFKSCLSSMEEELDNWMEAKPDFVKNIRVGGVSDPDDSPLTSAISRQ